MRALILSFLTLIFAVTLYREHYFHAILMVAAFFVGMWLSDLKDRLNNGE